MFTRESSIQLSTRRKRKFRPKGDGRSGPGVPPLPEKKLNILGVLNIEKLTRSVFWLFLKVN